MEGVTVGIRIGVRTGIGITHAPGVKLIRWYGHRECCISFSPPIGFSQL